MPVITVQQLPHDTTEKALLVERLTAAVVETYGVEPEKVQVFIAEHSRQNWGKGGRLGVDRASSSDASGQ